MTIRGLLLTAVVCILLSILPSPICSLNLFPLEINGKYGYIDETGQLHIKPTFKIANKFRDGRALVKLNDHMLFINEAGNMVFEIEERSETEFSEGLLAFRKSGKRGFVDCNGKIAIEPLWVRAVHAMHRSQPQRSRALRRHCRLVARRPQLNCRALDPDALVRPR